MSPTRLLDACTMVLAVGALAACATRPINEPIERVERGGGYRGTALAARPDNDPGTVFVIAFSGGGTRAAAFAYGVLEELRRTRIVVDGQPRRLLDEVDVMTGVSGGSFTALSYALHGERLFDQYEQRFLKQDVQGALTQRLFTNLLKVSSTDYGRSELAADYYDEILFGGATFGDLASGTAPRAVVVATDISTGARFPFTQSQFDLICSDLGKVRLSRAAAASSAVPIVLSPVTFNNYGGRCGYKYPDWVEAIHSDRRARPAGRIVQRVREMELAQDATKRPYIHLVDGGVADNLGLRGILESLEGLEAGARYRDDALLQRLRRLVVIVVNARSAPDTDWDRSASPPSSLFILLQSASVPIDRYSHESIETLKDIVARWNLLRELATLRAQRSGDSAPDAPPPVTLYAIDVSFDGIEDPVERSYFMNLPTSFALAPEAVDRLRGTAGRLLRESREFEALVRELGATGTR